MKRQTFSPLITPLTTNQNIIASWIESDVTKKEKGWNDAPWIDHSSEKARTNTRPLMQASIDSPRISLPVPLPHTRHCDNRDKRLVPTPHPGLTVNESQPSNIPRQSHWSSGHGPPVGTMLFCLHLKRDGPRRNGEDCWLGGPHAQAMLFESPNGKRIPTVGSGICSGVIFEKNKKIG